jgi:outer membrane protein assembly factor BamD
MRKLVFVTFILASIIGCSSIKNTSEYTPQEHFDYAMGLFNNEDYQEASNEFQAILLQYPASTVNDDAQYYLGFTYYKKDQYLLAAYEFSKLIRDIPASPFIPEAQYMLAESYYQLSPPYQLDQAYTKKAIDEYQAFIDYFPVDAKVEEASTKIKELNGKIAEKEYKSALIYERMSYYNAAIDYYGIVAETYHDTKYAPMSLYNKIQLEMMKEMKGSALNDIADFLTRYPDDTKAEELTKLQETLLAKNNN